MGLIKSMLKPKFSQWAASVADVWKIRNAVHANHVRHAKCSHGIDIGIVINIVLVVGALGFIRIRFQFANEL